MIKQAKRFTYIVHIVIHKMQVVKDAMVVILLAKTLLFEHREGRITLSEAAHKAGLTLWDFQHYLVDTGFVSSYSIEDINEELELLKKKHK